MMENLPVCTECRAAISRAYHESVDVLGERDANEAAAGARCEKHRESPAASRNIFGSGLLPLAAPRVTLSNGLTLANFSSPHPFKFMDGSVLPPCSPERVRALPLKRFEEERHDAALQNAARSSGVVWTTVRVAFSTTPAVRASLDALESDLGVDIIIAPRVVLDALRRDGLPIGKVRTVLVADRDGPGREKLNFIDRFCA